MKAFKGFMIYTGIVLLSLVIIGALVIGMMFFTKIQLFGYYFVQTNKNDYFHGEISFANPDGVTGDQLSSIVPIKNVNLNIETGAYGILVEPISDLDKKELKIYTDNIYVGFLDGSALGDNLDDNRYPRIKVVKQHDNAGNMEINITLSEPQGLLSMSELSLLRLRVPFKVNEEVVTYNINAKTHNGNIKLINSKDDKGDFADPLVVTGLKLETNKGDVSLEGFGNKYGKKTENLVLDNLDIKTNGGTFDFTNFRNVKVNRKVTLDSEKANYYFNVLDARNGINGGVEINGTVVKFVADAVYCGMDGFIYKTSTGVLKINNLFTGNIEENIEAVTEKDAENNDVPTGELKRKITSADPYENTIFTDSAVVELGTVVGKLGLYNEFGDVTINLLSNQASVRTENGNITIKKSGVLLNEQDEDINYANKSSMILYSDFGDIYVGEYYQDAVLYSKKGKYGICNSHRINYCSSHL